MKERLTNQKWSDDIDLTQEYGYQHIYKRLYEYEDLEEQGLIVRLPCKVGDTIYYISNKSPITGNRVCYVHKVKGYYFDGNNLYYDLGIFREKVGSKNICFTAEEAEATLKELRGGV